jgi:hypothetical protein
MKTLLADLDVETVDAARLAARSGVTIRDGWQLKPLALVGCRFAEVLMLDADQVPVVDPTVAFDWPQYREAGAVFWPDILDIKAENPIWAALGLPAERRVSLESGQVLVDKRRHGGATLATLALNEMAETTYRYVYGDKDTFLLGWMLADESFAVAPHRPFIEERSLTQRDFAGAPFLQHRTNCKWTYSGAQYSFKGAVHEEACAAALAELRAAWNGRIFLPPPCGLRARRAESALIEAKRLRCEVVGDEGFDLEFWSDGEFGAGRSADRANWRVEDDSAQRSGLALTIEGRNGETTYRLSLQADGSWAGERRRMPPASIVAAPPSSSTDPAPSPGARRGLVDDVLAVADLSEPDARDEASVRAALVLLSRVEPEVAERLRRLAQAPGAPPPLAARLARLAAVVEATRTPALGNVQRNSELFDQYYVKVPDPLLGWQN